MRRLLTLDEFSKLPDDVQLRDAGDIGLGIVSVDQPEFMDDSRVITYTFSTPAVARDLHTVASGAWQMGNFERNPVFLWAHDDTQPPIGRVVNIDDVNGKLKGGVEYTDRDLNPFGDMIFRMVKARFLNAVSTSWLPLAWSRSTDKDRPGGIDFKKVDLLEISQVPIPALPTALAEARSAGIDTGPMFRWAEKILDLGGSMVLPRVEIEQLRRAAKMAKPTDPKNSTLAAKHARAIARAPKVPVFKRGLYDLSQLACLLCNLGYCHDSAEYEAELEGDGSAVPGMLGEALVTLGGALKAMAVEEVDEFLAMHDHEEDDEEVDDLEMRSFSASDRANIAAAKSPRARAWRVGLARAVVGRAMSASTQEKLGDAQDHHERALKHSRALKENHDSVSEHLKDARATHGKTTSTLKDLGEHVRAAQAEPEKAADHLKRAVESHGATEEHLGDMADDHTNLLDKHVDAGDSHNSMERSVKRAQRCVRSAVSGAVTSEADEPGADANEDGEAAKEEKARQARAARAQELINKMPPEPVTLED